MKEQISVQQNKTDLTKFIIYIAPHAELSDLLSIAKSSCIVKKEPSIEYFNNEAPEQEVVDAVKAGKSLFFYISVHGSIDGLLWFFKKGSDIVSLESVLRFINNKYQKINGFADVQKVIQIDSCFSGKGRQLLVSNAENFSSEHLDLCKNLLILTHTSSKTRTDYTTYAVEALLATNIINKKFNLADNVWHYISRSIPFNMTVFNKDGLLVRFDEQTSIKGKVTKDDILQVVDLYTKANHVTSEVERTELFNRAKQKIQEKSDKILEALKQVESRILPNQYVSDSSKFQDLDLKQWIRISCIFTINQTYDNSTTKHREWLLNSPDAAQIREVFINLMADTCSATVSKDIMELVKDSSRKVPNMAQIVEMAAYSVAVLVRFTALQQNKLSQEQIEVLCSEEALYIMRTNVSAYEYLVELAQKKNIDANEIKNFCSKRMRPLLFRGSRCYILVIDQLISGKINKEKFAALTGFNSAFFASSYDTSQYGELIKKAQNLNLFAIQFCMSPNMRVIAEEKPNEYLQLLNLIEKEPSFNQSQFKKLFEMCEMESNLDVLIPKLKKELGLQTIIHSNLVDLDVALNYDKDLTQIVRNFSLQSIEYINVKSIYDDFKKYVEIVYSQFHKKGAITSADYQAAFMNMDYYISEISSLCDESLRVLLSSPLVFDKYINDAQLRGKKLAYTAIFEYVMGYVAKCKNKGIIQSNIINLIVLHQVQTAFPKDGAISTSLKDYVSWVQQQVNEEESRLMLTKTAFDVYTMHGFGIAQRIVQEYIQRIKDGLIPNTGFSEKSFNLYIESGRDVQKVNRAIMEESLLVQLNGDADLRDAYKRMLYFMQTDQFKNWDWNKQDKENSISFQIPRIGLNEAKYLITAQIKKDGTIFLIKHLMNGFARSQPCDVEVTSITADLAMKKYPVMRMYPMGQDDKIQHLQKAQDFSEKNVLLERQYSQMELPYITLSTDCGFYSTIKEQVEKAASDTKCEAFAIVPLIIGQQLVSDVSSPQINKALFHGIDEKLRVISDIIYQLNDERNKGFIAGKILPSNLVLEQSTNKVKFVNYLDHHKININAQNEAVDLHASMQKESSVSEEDMFSLGQYIFKPLAETMFADPEYENMHNDMQSLISQMTESDPAKRIKLPEVTARWNSILVQCEELKLRYEQDAIKWLEQTTQSYDTAEQQLLLSYVRIEVQKCQNLHSIDGYKNYVMQYIQRCAQDIQNYISYVSTRIKSPELKSLMLSTNVIKELSDALNNTVLNFDNIFYYHTMKKYFDEKITTLYSTDQELVSYTKSHPEYFLQILNNAKKLHCAYKAEQFLDKYFYSIRAEVDKAISNCTVVIKTMDENQALTAILNLASLKCSEEERKFLLLCIKQAMIPDCKNGESVGDYKNHLSLCMQKPYVKLAIDYVRYVKNNIKSDDFMRQILLSDMAVGILQKAVEMDEVVVGLPNVCCMVFFDSLKENFVERIKLLNITEKNSIDSITNAFVKALEVAKVTHKGLMREQNLVEYFKKVKNDVDKAVEEKISKVSDAGHSYSQRMQNREQSLQHIELG